MFQHYHTRRGYVAFSLRISMSSNNILLLMMLLFVMTTLLLRIPTVSGFCPTSTRTTTTSTFFSSSSHLSFHASSSSSSLSTSNTLLYAKKVPKKQKKKSGSSSPSSSSSSSHFASSAAAASAADFTSKSNHDSDGIVKPVDNNQSIRQRPPSFPIILWRFTRPHTIIGSAMAIPALHLLAAPSLSAAMSMRTVYAILYAMIPALLMNLYITGLNQITDVEIDKINKPYLPIAAGILSKRTAIITVIIALLSSLYLGQMSTTLSTSGLNVALYGSAILGTLYSLPPFRFKRFPILAAFCIVAVRGAIINAAFFAHAMQAAAYSSSTATTTTITVLSCLQKYKSCMYSSAFFAIFGLVIALMKDVPDVIGDRIANIFTVSVRIGPNRVLYMMRWLLTCLFWSVSATFATMAWNVATTASSNSSNVGLITCRVITSVASLVAGWSVQRQARNVNAEDSGQVYKYYMHLWKLFYLSYLVLPFCR